jgi:hypothetical protein
MFALIGLLWGWIAYPWLSGEVTIPYDAKAHFQAQIQFLANALHRGDSPFWTPNIFGGSPQIADPQSLIFSPAILLALFDAAPSFRSMDGYVLGLLLIGGLAFAQFGRERGWHPAAQVLAALVFAFGASASWRLQHVGQVQSLACFAVALWLLARALRHGSWKSGLGAGAAAAVMVVTPDQVAYLGVYVLAAYVLWFLIHDGAPLAALRRSAPALLAGSLVGLVLVAVPLAMTVLFSEVSSRAEIDYAEAARGSLHPASLLTAFVGDLFGAKDPAVEFWGPSSFAWSPANLTLSQNMGQVYVGALPVLAIVFWLARGGWAEKGEARFMLGAVLASVVYAIGAYTPLYPLIFSAMPGADLFRRPADATFMIGALLALLGGHALNEVLRQDAAGQPDRLRSIRALGLTLLLMLAAWGAAAAVAAWHGQLGVAMPALGSAAIWLGASVGLIAVLVVPNRFVASGPALKTALAVGLGLFMAADLKANNGPNESTALPPALYAEMEPNTDNHTISYLQSVLARSHREPGRRDRVELLGMAFHWPNLGMIHGFDHAFGYNPLHMAEFTEATGARDHMGGAQDRKFTPMFPSFRSAFADMLGLRFIVSAVPIERVDRSLKPGDLALLARTRDGFIYENTRALPRALFVPAMRLADFDAKLEKGLPQDFDPRSSVLLEQVPDGFDLTPPVNQVHQGPNGISERGRDRSAAVRLVSYANTEVVIEVDAPRAGFLVLNDIWHPWWGATVNSAEVEVLKANVLFRAVQVAEGHSIVRFSFRPLDGMIADLKEKVLGPDDAEAPASIAMVP